MRSPTAAWRPGSEPGGEGPSRDSGASSPASSRGVGTRKFRFGVSARPVSEPVLDAGAMVGDRYRIESLIGEGGMGRVYRARHVFLDRPVAIKVLRGDARTDPDSVQRFQREALAASKVGHASIVEVSDFAMMADGQVFLAMELLEGESLEAWMERPGTLDQAVRHLEQAADGLAAAHRAGVIHRDIKPANIFLARSGPDAPAQAKLLDFGIAKMATERVGGYTTNNGAVLGTPYYLAPERARGKEPDPRADIYSLGVILYEMLTGALPFTADNFMTILGHHMRTAPVDPRLAAPDRAMPDEVATLCMAMLEKDPADRPPDADRVAAQLAGLRRRRAAELRAVPTGPRSAVSSADADTQALSGVGAKIPDAVTAALPAPVGETGSATASRAEGAVDRPPSPPLEPTGVASSSRGPRLGAVVIAAAVVVGAAAALVFVELRPGAQGASNPAPDGASTTPSTAAVGEAQGDRAPDPALGTNAAPEAPASTTSVRAAVGTGGIAPDAPGEVEVAPPAPDASSTSDGKTVERTKKKRKRPRTKVAPPPPSGTGTAPKPETKPESKPETKPETKPPSEIKDDIYGD